MKCSVFIATSLDGFIARPDGTIDWLSTPSSDDLPGEDFGYQAFVDAVDAIVMGRGSFEKVLSFNEWPYGDKPVIVLSGRGVTIPAHLRATTEGMSLTPVEVVSALSERGFKQIYVDGGRTIQGFIKAGLIQKLIISRIPVLIGSGLPLFGGIPHDVELKHIATRSFRNGLVQSEYEVQNSGPENEHHQPREPAAPSSRDSS